MNPISPKVTHGTVAATIATLILQVLNDSTPETLAVFGKYEPIAAGLVPILAFAITAYLKTDPLRVVRSETPAAPSAQDTAAALELAQNLVAKAVAPYPVPSELPTVPANPAA